MLEYVCNNEEAGMMEKKKIRGGPWDISYIGELTREIGGGKTRAPFLLA